MYNKNAEKVCNFVSYLATQNKITRKTEKRLLSCIWLTCARADIPQETFDEFRYEFLDSIKFLYLEGLISMELYEDIQTLYFTTSADHYTKVKNGSAS